MPTEHGANLFEISDSLNIDKKDILDFSSNINPLGASEKAKKAVIDNIDMVSIYPDPNYKRLKKAISNYCRCSLENIILGEGATELISSCIEAVFPKKALLLSPAYSEYEKELKKIDCDIIKYFYEEDKEFQIRVSDLILKIKELKPEMVIICNPNNPTGSTFTREEIKRILEETDAFVMIDETYVEFCDYALYSSTSLTDHHQNLLVIRGTSKFFSTPGIRLGYGLTTNKSIYEKISRITKLWNINIFAEIMGGIMFQDTEYLERCRKLIKEESEFLSKELKSISQLHVYDSKSNFILCRIDSPGIDAKILYDKLLPLGIIIRNASSFEGLGKSFFRVCILSPEANRLLIKHLKEIFINKA